MLPFGLLAILAACSAGSDADELRQSTISAGRSSPSTPGFYTGDAITIHPDRTVQRWHQDGYPKPGEETPPDAYRISEACRKDVIAAIVAAKLGRIRQGAPRVGGGDASISISGPAGTLHVSSAAARDDDADRISAVASKIFGCPPADR